MYFAADLGNLDLCRMFVLTGRVDVNKAESDGERLLRIAALHGHLPVVRFLVEKGADINGKDSDGFTPLMSAAGALNTLIVQFLLDRGADKDIKAKNGMTAAGFAGTGSTSLGSEALVKMINDHQSN
uniref:ANK_REP_REGION domain-containing protein n=1 Tax=Globodera pallida TaxID=36090 RepID=A0A183BKI3_GLOPA